ncbi:MAG TPA: anthranilate phosphoribosyltransferase [Longimicrobiales bacterium]|nr:anthranilate phosphoribosyltransferase [Longimicrobiales bacterium]
MTDEAERPEGPTLKELIVRLSAREHLGADEARAAFEAVMGGRASQIQVAGLLVGLRTKGEVAAEVAGGVRALRDAMVPVVAEDAGQLVDTCGTGGGDVTTFNISTAAALLAAGMGVRIAKHGNRSFTSRCGSADVLEALGVDIELTPEAMAEVLAEAGIVFMFAPLLHPAMRHVAPVRRELGMPTIMNLLGPLTNPAGARRQVVGVTRPDLLDLVAGALRELDHERALVVHGAPGLDELSPIGLTDVAELRDGAVRRYRVEPGAFGWGHLDPAGLAGGDPADNARVILEVFRGEGNAAARAAVTLNAGAAVYIAGRADSLEGGVRAAEQALDEGAGLAGLERLREATRRVRN